jgi:hypothetical protein
LYFFNPFSSEHTIIQSIKNDEIDDLFLMLIYNSENPWFVMGDKEKLESIFIKYDIKPQDLNEIRQSIKEIASVLYNNNISTT